MSFLAQRAPWGPRPFGSFLGALAKFGLGQEAGPVRRQLVTVVPLQSGGRTSTKKRSSQMGRHRGPQSPAVKGRADRRSGSAGQGVPTSGTLRAACCPSFGNGRMPSDRNGLDFVHQTKSLMIFVISAPIRHCVSNERSNLHFRRRYDGVRPSPRGEERPADN